MPASSLMSDFRQYHAYLVRLTRPRADLPWQIVAKDIETGDEFPFGTLEGLLDFLNSQIEEKPGSKRVRP